MISETLKRVQIDFLVLDARFKAKGFAGSGENPQVAAYEASDAFPLPWYSVGSPEGIYTLYAANRARVASWLTRRDADTAINEVTGNV